MKTDSSPKKPDLRTLVSPFLSAPLRVSHEPLRSLSTCSVPRKEVLFGAGYRAPHKFFFQSPLHFSLGSTGIGDVVRKSDLACCTARISGRYNTDFSATQDRKYPRISRAFI